MLVKKIGKGGAGGEMERQDACAGQAIEMAMVCIHSIKQRPRPPLSTRRIERSGDNDRGLLTAGAWPGRRETKMVARLLEIGVRWPLLAVLLLVFGAFSSAERE